MVDFSQSASPVFKADLNDPELIKRIIPTGGSAGMSLIKSTSDDYAADWVWFTAVPPSGLKGQVLTKNSDTSGDVGWTTKVRGALMYHSIANTPVPTGGIVPFSTMIFNNGGIVAHSNGRFRLEHGHSYEITASLPSTFNSVTDNITYYICINGNAIGNPSVQFPVNASILQYFNTVVTWLVEIPLDTVEYNIDVRSAATAGTVQVTAYSNFIKIVEL
jgi:hypothetical protein